MSQLEALLEVVGPRVGVVRSLTLRPKSAVEPDLPILYDAVLSHFDFRKGDRIERGACGKGLTERDAMLGALGEALEHYCASHAPSRSMRRAARAALAGATVTPAELVPFSPAQYAEKTLPFWAWRETDEIAWVRMRELGTCTAVWAPAAHVYLRAASSEPADALCAPTSSGLAAGPDLRHAVRAALLELFEREAFLVTWLHRLSAPEIDAGGDERQPTDAGEHAVARDICERFARAGMRVRAFLLPTDMPVAPVLALALDQTGAGPAAIAGLGCDLNPSRALRKALFEICQMYEPLARKHAAGVPTNRHRHADVTTIEQHADYFLCHDHLVELDFLLHDSRRRIALADIPSRTGATVEDDLGTLDEGVRAAGQRALFKDLTTPDLAKYPIKVARALVTEVQPIHFGYGQERLGGKRLYELPGKTGHALAPSLNRCPHPLA